MEYVGLAELSLAVRFSLRTLLVLVGLAAGCVWLFKHIWSGPSPASRGLLAISTVLLATGAVLALTPPLPRGAVRPGWVGQLPRVILWATAFGILVQMTDIHYLVLLSCQGMMLALPGSSDSAVLPLEHRAYWVLALGLATLAVGIVTGLILTRLTRLVSTGQLDARRPPVRYSLPLLTGTIALCLLALIEVRLGVPLVSKSYSEAFGLAVNRLDLVVLVVGFGGLCGGIAARIARIYPLGETRQPGIPGMRGSGLFYQVGWFLRLALGVALIPIGVSAVLGKWGDRLPKAGNLVFYVPESAAQLPDIANLFVWLVVAAAVVWGQSFFLLTVMLLRRRAAFAVERGKFCLPLFLFWWAFLTAACLSAIPTVGLLLFPAWHLYLLHTV